MEDTGIKQYGFTSDSQYYFLSMEDLINIFSIPIEILELIYYYLPKKSDLCDKNEDIINTYGYYF